jgi:PAS domain S-box-containing protein
MSYRDAEIALGIMDKKLPQQKFVETIELYRQLIQSLPAAIYICDAQGFITIYNKPAAELWGKEPEIGKDLWCGSWKIFDAGGNPLPFDKCPMAVTLREGIGVEGEEIIIERPDGARRNVLPHPKPLFDESGKLAGAVNLLMDITDQKLFDEKIAKLAAIVHSSDDAIISKTLDGIVTSWNDAAKKIFGYTASEMIGEPISKLIPRDYYNEEPAILNRIRKGESVDHYETKRITKDGRVLDISLTISPIKDRRNNIIGVSKIARDITKQKENEKLVRESEDRYRSLAEELEKLVLEKTEDLSQLNKELQRSNIELEQFAYVASHDLQEPLRKIRIFGKMVLEENSENLSNSGRDYLVRMVSAADRMHNLIEALLDFSRTATTYQELEQRNINDLIDEVKKELQDIIEEKNAEIEVALIPELPVIPFQFKQMLFNVIGNSLKYAKEEIPPLIKISATTMKGEKTGQKSAVPGMEYCKLTIADNGIGFEPQYKEKIFGLFQRLHGRNEYSGAGLGLAICKKIAKNHNGFISAESEAGKGTSIHIFIPL